MGDTPPYATAAFGSIWVTDTQNDLVYRIDPRSRETLAATETDVVPIHVLGACSSLWVIAFEGGTLQRIDPATNAGDLPSVLQSWQWDTQPHNGFFVKGFFWTAASDDGSLLGLDLGLSE